MSILQYINLGLDLLVVGVLLFCLLRGFISGFKKSLIRVIAFVVPFVLLICFLGDIAKSLLGFDISQFDIGDGFTTVNDFVITFIKENVYQNGTMDIENSELYNLVQSAAIGILKFAIYMLGITLIFVIIGPILKLILRFIFWIIGDDKVVNKETGKKEKKKKTLGTRLLGMALGCFEFALFFIVFLMPLCGTLSLSKLAVDDLNYTYEIIGDSSESGAVNVSEEENPVEGILKEILKTEENDLSNLTTTELFEEFNRQYDGGVVRKILNVTKNKKTEVTLDAKYLGSLLTVKTKHGKLDFVDEYANLRRVIPVITTKFHISVEDQTFDFSEVTAEDITTVCDVIKNIQAIKIVLPVGYEVLCYSVENGEFEEIEIDLTNIKNLDINKELDTLIEVIEEVGLAIVELDIDINEPLNVLENPALKDSFGNIIGKVLELQVINDIALPFVVEKLSEVVVEIKEIDTQYIEKLITKENIIKVLKEDSVLLIETTQKAYGVGKELINGTSQKLDPISESEKVLIKDIIMNIFNLSIISGHEEDMIKMLLSVEAIKEYVPENVMEDVTIDWQSEPEKIADIVVAVISLIEIENITVEYFIDNKDLTLDIVSKVASSDLFRKACVLLIENLYKSEIEKEESAIPEGLEGVLNFEPLKTMTSDEFEAEMVNIVEIVYGLKDMNILFGPEGEQVDISNPDVIKDVVERIFDICLIKNNEAELLTFLLDTLEINDMLAEYGITLDFNNVNWETEPSKLAEVIVEIANLCGGDLASLNFENILEVDPETGLRDQEKINQIGKVLDAFNESQIFEPVIFDLLETMIANIDESLSFELTFTTEEKALIKANGWTNEINRTLNVYDIANEKLLSAEDLSSIEGSTVSSLMKEASGSVIASKVLGTVLIESLGTNGYDKLPKNEDGTYKYDFTDPQVLYDQADNIGGLIDLANSMNNLNTDTMTEEETVQKLVEELKNLENNELAKDVINEVASEYLGNEIDLEGVNFEDEATVIEDVFEIYHADPEHFDIENNEELKEKVENSTLAKSILEMLGLA